MRKGEIFEVQSDAKLAYTAGLASILPVGNLGAWLVGLRLEFEIAKTDGASPIAYQDWLARVATGLVVSGGNRTYLNSKTRDLRGLYWWNRQRWAGGERMPDFETGSQTFYWPMTVLFTTDPLKYDGQPNLWPINAGIAPDNNLQIEVDWAANSALGSNITIGAATLCRVTYLVTFPGTKVPGRYPSFDTTIYSPQQPYSGLQGAFDIAVGKFYRRTSLIFTNGVSPNDVRTNGEASNAISEVGLGGIISSDEFKLKVRSLARQSQIGFQVADDNSGVPGAAALYAAATTKDRTNPGVGYFDWTQIADLDDVKAANDPQFGLNMVQSGDAQPRAQGAAKILFTVDTSLNTNVLIFNEGYSKYPWAS